MRRATILDGATRAFAQAGFTGTSMPDIARASGITPLIVYRHFDSKEHLYRTILERVGAGLSCRLGAAPTSEGFGVGAGAFLDAARENPDGFHLLWRHAAREPLFASYAADLRESAVGVVEASLSDRVAPSALSWSAHAIVGYLIEAVLNWLEFGDARQDARFVTATNEAMRAGVKAWSPKSQAKSRKNRA